jgi:tetratricopeptide (TPR) repeat protein
MRQYLFFLCFIISHKIISGQSKIENIISDATCACIGNIAENNEDKFKECFVKVIGNNISPLVAEAKKRYGEANEETGRKLGNAIMQNLIVDMVFSCDAYYNEINKVRFLTIENANKDSIRKALQQLSAVDSSIRDVSFFTKRGILFFSLLQLDDAVEDFNHAIQKDSSAALQSLYFKAWSLEIQTKYAEAEKLYSQLAVITKNKNIEVMAAIVRRKMRGWKN